VVIGDGEAETGTADGLAALEQVPEPDSRRGVLPILHLNGYKIANTRPSPPDLSEELHSLFVALAGTPYLVEGDDPALMHQQMAATLDECVTANPFDPGRTARASGHCERPRWPMIILRTPKADCARTNSTAIASKGAWRAHINPRSPTSVDPTVGTADADAWMSPHHPEDLFDAEAGLFQQPEGRSRDRARRMSANPHAQRRVPANSAPPA
jgi:xylulose-5-phosphate/fructose-6-phosphate phosphoketolase